jgi:hypothetical protein
LGTYISTPNFSGGNNVGTRTRLTPPGCSVLVEAGVLFFVGHHGETRVMQHLKNNNAIVRSSARGYQCRRLILGKRIWSSTSHHNLRTDMWLSVSCVAK